MKPTPEQLEAVARAIAHLGGAGAGEDFWGGWTSEAQAAWDVIAPLVLEAAAHEAEDEDETFIASWIRARCIDGDK